MDRLEHYINTLSKIVFFVSLAVLAGLMFLTAADIIGRGLGRLIVGSYQIIEIMQVGLICLAWPLTTGKMGHVRVDVLLGKFPQKLRNKVEIFNHAVCAVIFAIISYQGVALVKMSWDLNELISIINIPLFPFQVVVPLGASLSCLVLLLQIVKLLRPPREGRD